MVNAKVISAAQADASAESAPVDGVLMQLSIGLGVLAVSAFAAMAALLPKCLS